MTTITREQFESAVRAAGVRSPYAGEALQRALTALGITVAEPEPPAAMLGLAREIVAEMWRKKGNQRIAERCISGQDDDDPDMLAALAALQHAAKAAEEAEQSTHPVQVILNKLGAK